MTWGRGLLNRSLLPDPRPNETRRASDGIRAYMGVGDILRLGNHIEHEKNSNLGLKAMPIYLIRFAPQWEGSLSNLDTPWMYYSALQMGCGATLTPVVCAIS